MKCAKCGYDNLLKANYCRECGQLFSQKEKDEARKEALVGKLEKADDIKA